MSHNVVVDESASWYSLPILDDSMLITETEISEVEMMVKEEEIDTPDESPVSFRLSGPNEETASSEESVVQSPPQKLRRRGR